MRIGIHYSSKPQTMIHLEYYIGKWARLKDSELKICLSLDAL